MTSSAKNLAPHSNPALVQQSLQSNFSRDGISNKDELLKANIVRASGAGLRNLHVCATASVPMETTEQGLNEMPDEPAHNSPRSCGGSAKSNFQARERNYYPEVSQWSR